MSSLIHLFNSSSPSLVSKREGLLWPMMCLVGVVLGLVPSVLGDGCTPVESLRPVWVT